PNFYPAPILPPLYNTGYYNPAPANPVSLAVPAFSSGPIASVSALTALAPAPVTTILGVIIADFIINTGNPQVSAVLNLIALNPALLDNPFLLNSLINTGNPDVASALAWLSSAI
ncbi:hypothetical protein JXL19_13200, partial [bacterium]|nr:hypothetical protein [bacterium]